MLFAVSESDRSTRRGWPIGSVLILQLVGCTPESYDSPPGADWTHVEAGANLTCGTKRSGEARCWGFGVSDGGSVPDGPFVDIAVGWELCGVHADGDVVCGDRSRELVPSRRPARTSGSWVAIAGDREGFCGITTDGALDCAGYRKGTVPEGTGYVAIDGDADLYCALDRDGSAVCWSMDPSDTAAAGMLPPGRYVDVDVAAFAGLDTACALTVDGAVVCSDEASPPDGTYVDVSAGEGNCAIRADGTIECWGRYYDDYGDAMVPSRSGYVEVTVGAVQGCALHESGEIDCWQPPVPEK